LWVRELGIILPAHIIELQRSTTEIGRQLSGIRAKSQRSAAPLSALCQRFARGRLASADGSDRFDEHVKRPVMIAIGLVWAFGAVIAFVTAKSRMQGPTLSAYLRGVCFGLARLFGLQSIGKERGAYGATYSLIAVGCLVWNESIV